MLFVLIPSLIVVASLIAAGRIIYKKIPQDREFFDAAVSKENFGPTFYEKALASFSVKAKQATIKASTKLIYKLKITSLKTDNFFGRLLQEMKSHRDNLGASTVGSFSTEPIEKESLKSVDFKVSAVAVADAPEIPKIKLAVSDFKNSQPVISPFEREEQQLINRLTYNSKDVSAYKRLGWLYLENNKPIQAKQSFKTAVKLGSKDKIIMTKLLEMGEAIHKEGAARHTVAISASKVVGQVGHINASSVSIQARPVVAEPVLVKSGPIKSSKESKKSHPKTKKLKVKKV